MSKQGDTQPGYLKEAWRAGQQMRTLAHGNLGPGERKASEAWLRAMGWEQCRGCLDKVTGKPRACYETGWHLPGAGGA